MTNWCAYCLVWPWGVYDFYSLVYYYETCDILSVIVGEDRRISNKGRE